MEHLIQLHIEKLPEGVYLATSDDVQGLIAQGRTLQETVEIARDVAKTLQKQGLRVALDLRNEKITYKIREHSLHKVPYLLVVGDKERASGAVAVRARGNQDLGVMALDAFSQKIAAELAPVRAE